MKDQEANGKPSWVNDPSFDGSWKSFEIRNLQGYIDPFLVWKIASGQIGQRVPLLIKLRSDKKINDLLKALQKEGDKDDSAPPIDVANWDDGAADSCFLTARVGSVFFRNLLSKGSLAPIVERFEFGQVFESVNAVPLDELLRNIASSPPNGRSKPSVVVGIVDDGVAFAHDRFLDKNGNTRILAFWDQRTLHPGAGTGGGVSPKVPYGLELDSTAIDGLRQSHRHAGLVDEDALYASVGQTQVRQRARHGTHVLDVAAGAGPVETSEALIVAVQLPSTIAADASGANLAPYLYDAVRYIVARADQLAAGPSGNFATSPVLPPVVINLSYGLMGGPHDGSSLLEQALANLVAKREGTVCISRQPPNPVMSSLLPGKAPLAIVIAAGNSALERCHAQFDLSGKSSQTLQWRIPPDCRTDSYLEIWVRGKGSIAVTVTPPMAGTGPASVHRASRPAYLLQPGPAAPGRWLLASLSYVKGAKRSSLQGGGTQPPRPGYFGQTDMVLVAVAPTEGLDLDRAWGPPGVWTVEVRNPGAKSVTVHAWIRRNDSPFGWRTGGRQSRFEDAAYQIFDDHGRLQEEDLSSLPHVRRGTTLNGIATGKNVIVVGASRADDPQKPTPYSAHGPALSNSGAARQGPDGSAPADRSAARPGVAGAGTRSGGSAVFLNGTSVAAPAVVRRLAEQFSTNPRIGSAQAFLKVVDTVNPPTQTRRSGLRLKVPVVTTRDGPP